jgi:hypothetical protein
MRFYSVSMETLPIHTWHEELAFHRRLVGLQIGVHSGGELPEKRTPELTGQAARAEFHDNHVPLRIDVEILPVDSEGIKVPIGF